MSVVVKRNGQIDEFDFSKIVNAVNGAYKSLGKEMPQEIYDILALDREKFEKLGAVEPIQDEIENILFNEAGKDVYNAFVLYRSSRALIREAKNKVLFDGIINAEKNDVTRDNANMNSDTPAGMMMKFASETTKPFADKYILSRDVLKASKDNILYIHDKDYYLTKSLTCLQHPLDRILGHGFMAGHGEARPAKRIETAAILAAISMETIQNEMHGGQAIPAFDFYMAPYVRMTYKEEVDKLKEIVPGKQDSYWDSIKNAKISDYLIANVDVMYGEYSSKNRYKQIAINNTVKRVHQAMESFIHNMNSIHSRGGNQVVFSSINYGTDTSAEGRCIIRELLLSTERGVGNDATAIFPIQIWKLKKGVSKNPGDPNYDLFKLSTRVSARRFFPNYLNLDSSFNFDSAWNKKDPKRYEHEVATMGALAGKEHLYIKIDDNEPVDISIKDFYEYCKTGELKNYRPCQIFFNKPLLPKLLGDKTLQSKTDFESKSGVYSITYIPEDITYIGSSKNINRRLAEHRSNIKLSGKIDAGVNPADRDLNNYKFEVLEYCEDYKSAEKRYIETGCNVNFKGVNNNYYKVTNTKFDKHIINRPNFKQNLSIQQKLINIEDKNIKVLDRNGQWTKIKHVFKNDKHNSPFMMHIYYIEHDKEYCLSCTEDHPLFNGEGFTRADELKVGDSIYRADGLEMKISKISWHWCTIDSYDIGTVSGSFVGSDIIMHNCRTRVYENRFGEKTSVGRGNLSFTTLNFPKIAIEVAIEDGFLVKTDTGYEFCMDKNTEEDKQRRVKRFGFLMRKYALLAAKQLDERFQFQKTALVKQFPLLMSGMWNGSDKLNREDTIESVINQGTLGIGFIGLAEALIALTGKHHGESDESQNIGLGLISKLKSIINEVSEQYQHNYAVLATPAEGLSGKFTETDKKIFGVIPGITDKDYYTNSNHVPVYYKCTAQHKAEIECPYHKLTTGGHIFYVEADADITKNPQVIEAIVNMACDNDGGYISINHTQGRCNICNYESNDPSLIEGGKCPHCGAEHSWDVLQRITGYLVGTTDRWNNGKYAELKDRVQHN